MELLLIDDEPIFRKGLAKLIQKTQPISKQFIKLILPKKH